jgi:hypothetical protein
MRGELGGNASSVGPFAIHRKAVRRVCRAQDAHTILIVGWLLMLAQPQPTGTPQRRGSGQRKSVKLQMLTQSTDAHSPTRGLRNRTAFELYGA